jgi:hypothetical protein
MDLKYAIGRQMSPVDINGTMGYDADKIIAGT